MESTWNMPHSMWIPYGIHHFIWNMFWLRSHSFWDLHSTWNPYGMTMEWPNSTWNDGMSMWIPYGFHGMMIEWPNSTWNPYGMILLKRRYKYRVINQIMHFGQLTGSGHVTVSHTSTRLFCSHQSLSLSITPSTTTYDTKWHHQGAPLPPSTCTTTHDM